MKVTNELELNSVYKYPRYKRQMLHILVVHVVTIKDNCGAKSGYVKMYELLFDVLKQTQFQVECPLDETNSKFLCGGFTETAQKNFIFMFYFGFFYSGWSLYHLRSLLKYSN